MKKLLPTFLCVCIIVLLSLAFLISCDDETQSEGSESSPASESELETVTVTFVQGAHIPNTSVIVEKGTAVPEDLIPEPTPQAGYELSWENRDLTCITEDTVVNIVKTPIEYTLTYSQQEIYYTKAVKFTIEDLPLALERICMTNYKVEGWYADALYSKPITQIDKIGDCTVYVKTSSIPLAYEYDSTRDAYYVSKYFDLKINEDVVIPEVYEGKPVIGIKDGVFDFAFFLKSIVIPNSITELGENAFKSCNNLVSVTLPSNIKKIPNGAFYQCAHLESITLPDGITEIGDYAFLGCKALTEIKLPSTLTTIGNNTFAEMSIESISIPSSVTCLGKNAFRNCELLKSAELNCKITILDDYAFYSCKSLESLIVPEGVVEIGLSTLAGCSSLRSITLPSTLEEIEDDTFYGCESLYEVYNLSNLTLDKNDISESVLEIYTEPDSIERFIKEGDYEFYRTNSKYYLIAYHGTDESITLPSGVNDNTYEIARKAFYKNQTVKEVTLSAGVTKIGDYAFNASSITAVTFAQGVTEIGNGAFANTQIDSIELPSSLVKIGQDAFALSSVTTVVIGGTSPIEICESAFYQSELSAIDVSSRESISIGTNAFQDCKKLSRLELPSVIEKIGLGAFSGCEALNAVSLSENITEIPNSCFEGCKSLESVQVSSKITKIGSRAFSGCTALDVFDFGEEKLTLGEYAFSQCKLTELVIGDNITMEKGAFYNVGTKTLVIDTEAVPQIAFRESAITTLTLTDKVKTVEQYAFAECPYLERLVIGNGIEYVPDYAFSRCESLYSVTLGTAVKEISSLAFEKCIRIFEIYNFSELVITTGDAENHSGIGAYAMAIYTEDDETEHIFESSSGNFVFYQLGEEYMLILCRNVKSTLVLPSMDFNYSMNTNLLNGKSVLSELVIPDCVVEIGHMAVSECPNLKGVLVGNGVEYIGIGAFMANPKLLRVILGSGVVIIDNYAFSVCESLISMKIPASVKTIGAYAFYGKGFRSVIFESTQNWYAVSEDLNTRYKLDVSDSAVNAEQLSTVNHFAQYYILVIEPTQET